MAIKKSIEVKLRPTVAGGKTPEPLKGASRIQIRKDSLIELTGTVDNGRACYIERVDPDATGSSQRREAILWLTPDPNLGRGVAKVSLPFREAGDLNLTDQYRIVVADTPSEDARDILFEDITESESSAPIQEVWTQAWLAMLKAEIEILDYVFPGIVLKDLVFARDKRTFRVRSVNGSETNNCRVKPGLAEIVIATSVDGNEGSRDDQPSDLQIPQVSGLEEQVKKLNDFLLVSSSDRESNTGWHGLVLHGGSGTGKTMLLDHVSRTRWGSVHRVKASDKSKDIQDIFQTVTGQARSIVLIDDLDELIDKERANRSTVINALVEGLVSVRQAICDKEKPPKVIVIAACRDYITIVPEKLRRPYRLQRAILLPPMDMSRRTAVISSLSPPFHPDVKEQIICDLSDRTHAYNGLDLQKLLSTIDYLVAAKLHHMQPEAAGTESDVRPKPPADTAFYTDSLEAALLEIRPTAMQDVNLKPPPVRWDDISGQESVKRDLRLAVHFITRPKEEIQKFIRVPPKGFLLYGPPGCSKTMTAQAMATESGLNFFAVKGAELLNMYVGESERQIRDLFSRARAAAPSMIFFDEIDSIAGSRKGFGSDGGGATSQGGLNVLTTLLNEMDGFEDLRGVFVLAATNRPHALDPAIMRPGRFDEIIYVPPPDPAAREAILRKNSAGCQLAPDVDFARLAQLTEGNSGAEVAGTCQSAGKLAMRRSLDEPSSEGAISMADFEAAIAGQRKQITKQMLEGYAEWEKQFH
ncbi:hypothetical protein MCOR02_010910 [Pyricularia oryzae]|nr:hypothetical protein MCOR02_010910 [Pyricularia oryzae]